MRCCPREAERYGNDGTLFAKQHASILVLESWLFCWFCFFPKNEALEAKVAHLPLNQPIKIHLRAALDRICEFEDAKKVRNLKQGDTSTTVDYN